MSVFLWCFFSLFAVVVLLVFFYFFFYGTPLVMCAVNKPHFKVRNGKIEQNLKKKNEQIKYMKRFIPIFSRSYLLFERVTAIETSISFQISVWLITFCGIAHLFDSFFRFSLVLLRNNTVVFSLLFSYYFSFVNQDFLFKHNCLQGVRITVYGCGATWFSIKTYWAVLFLLFRIFIFYFQDFWITFL